MVDMVLGYLGVWGVGLVGVDGRDGLWITGVDFCFLFRCYFTVLIFILPILEGVAAVVPHEADWGVGVGELEGAVVVGEGVAVGVGDGDVLEEGEVHDAVGDGEGRELDDVDGDLRVFRFEEKEVINDDDSDSQEEQEDRGHYARGKVGCTAGLRSVRLGREMFDRPGGKAGGRRRGRCRTGRACPGCAGGQAGGRRSGSRRRCSRRQAPAPCIGTASLQSEDEADRGHYARVFVEIHIVIQKRGVDFTVPAGKNPTQRQIEAGHTMEKGGGFASWACEDRRSVSSNSRTRYVATTELWNLRSVLKSCAISRKSLWKGSLRISNSVLF
ncbi:hypothetical protein RJ640_010622 [Escallonia rubra]|uniref:Uncharacterized protein n=1 Tax=Escallonia rubra TaxID=112253 RepID=A0AA88UJX5_9ASTE|nr:hypothetical protein RJ640_010622 [Escallonia rubra]